MPNIITSTRPAALPAPPDRISASTVSALRTFSQRISTRGRKFGTQRALETHFSRLETSISPLEAQFSPTGNTLSAPGNHAKALDHPQLHPIQLNRTRGGSYAKKCGLRYRSQLNTELGRRVPSGKASRSTLAERKSFAFPARLPSRRLCRQLSGASDMDQRG